MIKSLVFQLLLAQILALITAQVAFQGSCPANIPVVNNFNVEKYLGRWHEYAKYLINFETDGKCITAEYSLREDGLVEVKNSMISERTNDESFIIGNATLVESGKLLVKFPISSIKTVSSNYWILATDYENYSVVYDCTQIKENEYEVSVWILTRQPLPEPNFIIKAIDVLKTKNISLNELKITNHVSCFCNVEINQ